MLGRPQALHVAHTKVLQRAAAGNTAKKTIRVVMQQCRRDQPCISRLTLLSLLEWSFLVCETQEPDVLA